MTKMTKMFYLQYQCTTECGICLNIEQGMLLPPAQDVLPASIQVIKLYIPQTKKATPGSS